MVSVVSSRFAGGFCRLWGVVLSSILIAMGGWAQEAPVPERAVKAALLYNFAKVVDWPAGTFEKTNSPIIIGVLGQDPAFVAALEKTVADKSIGSRRVAVKRFVVLADVTACQVLFVCDSERTRVSETLGGLNGRALLTVSDIAGFAIKGGVIELELVRPGPRFEIDVNLDAARERKLVISSRLLRLARRVYHEKN